MNWLLFIACILVGLNTIVLWGIHRKYLSKKTPKSAEITPQSQGSKIRGTRGVIFLTLLGFSCWFGALLSGLLLEVNNNNSIPIPLGTFELSTILAGFAITLLLTAIMVEIKARTMYLAPLFFFSGMWLYYFLTGFTGWNIWYFLISTLIVTGWNFYQWLRNKTVIQLGFSLALLVLLFEFVFNAVTGFILHAIFLLFSVGWLIWGKNSIENNSKPEKIQINQETDV